MFKRFVYKWGAVTLILASTQVAVNAQDALVLDSEDKKYSYAVGTRIAEQLKEQFGQGDSGMDIEALREGLSAGLGGSEPLMDEATATQVIQDRQRAEFEAAAAVALEAGERGKAYMDENRGKPGVQETESGIQYLVEEEGEGESPTAEDTVVVHYRGTLIDGTEFDSSYKRNNPASFPVNGVIPGWVEVLQLMKPGAKWSVVIPASLAYGERGAGGSIGPNETLLFDIELLEIK